MSQNMQVFAITHLPQIAAKGNTHFKVYKEDVQDVITTTTRLIQLNHDDRIIEIAQMLGGIEYFKFCYWHMQNSCLINIIFEE